MLSRQVSLPDCPAQRAEEFLEQRTSVVRPGRSLGMILHSKHGELAMAEAFDGPVVQVYVSDLEVAGTLNGALVALHCKPMVLGRYQNFTGVDLFDRVISAAMAIGHFGCGTAEGESQQLMPQADTKRGNSLRCQVANDFRSV